MKFVKRMKRRIHNLIKWFPLIWNDRDTDYRYLLEMQLLKVTNMEEFFRYGKTVSEDSPKVAEEMMVMRHALERIIADDYREKALRLNNLSERLLVTKELRRDVALLESKLRQDDLELVFSKDIASKIENWWD